MKLQKALGPLPVADLKAKYFGKKAVAIQQTGESTFADLVTPRDVELRLNDGVASLHSIAIIGDDGRKVPPDEIHQTQPVPSWSRAFVRKSRILEHLAKGHSFVLHNMTAINPEVEELIADIEETFDGVQADAHLYVSPRAGASSYQVHRDSPQHKIYLQVLGTTEWTVYQGRDVRRAMPVEEAERILKVDFRATMTPGSILYMPPDVFHRAHNPHGPRISLSIPFNEVPGTFKVDRARIRLTDYFA